MQRDSSEEAGPSNLSSNDPTSPAGPHLNSKIHFPVEPQHPRNHKLSKPVVDSTLLRLGRPVVNSNATTVNSKSGRQRVVSVDAGNGPRATVTKRTPTMSLGSPLQRVSSLRSTDSKESDSTLAWGLSSFSDEYDLYPRIIQDVQRALKLKYRREARVKSGQLNQPSANSTPSSPRRSLEPSSSPSKSTATAVSKPSVDIDFSPSTGPATLQVDFHPAPYSTDDGDTLDWSRHTSDDEKSERKWSMSVSKRKGKERELILSADDLQKQEGLHFAKLARIKTISSQLTRKKVAITSDQLSRRYNLIYSSLSSGSDRFNLLKVSRWYGEQETLVRSSLEKAEPFPWLKHLDKRTRKPTSDGEVEHVRMPWHLSALIMEEYLHAQHARNYAMRSIPEHTPIPDGVGDSTSSFFSSPPGEGISLPTFPSPSRASSSRFSLSQHISSEGRVSFEPLLEPPPLSRPSNDSRRSVESTFSSIFSGSSPKDQNARDHDKTGISSPASSRLHLRDGLGIRRKWGNDSDDNSSARNSAAEQSDDNADKSDRNDKGSKQTSWLGNGRSVSLVLRGTDTSRLDVPAGADESFVHVDEQHLGTAKPESTLPSATTVKVSLDSAVGEEIPDVQRASAPKIINRNMRPLRISLPSESRKTLALEWKRKQEADEARADMEYELKSQLVAQCKDSNTRIRSVLNHIAQHVREYETCQSSFISNTLGLPYNGGLPQDLLEAFSHDPANVTRSTKRLKTYKAVDDIHHRLTRQRAVFREFLEKNGYESRNQSTSSNGFPVTEDILREPIESLMQNLNTLEELRVAVIGKEKAVAEVLKKTQDTHATVKAEYNNALAHTSVVYPELSQIVALEESYKDQYQHLWDLGMDALTFILDTVTPFWRTYGRTIGDDVQAFLIIPLYRNEFTGESKRYPITRLPQRSFRHWIGLLLFFLLTIGVLALQTRAAWSCSVNYWLRWIPYDALRWAAFPLFWIGIVIQWMAVLGELFILTMQVGTVMWWVGWVFRLVS